MTLTPTLVTKIYVHPGVFCEYPGPNIGHFKAYWEHGVVNEYHSVVKWFE